MDRADAAAMYQGAARQGSDGLKAWAKFGESTTEGRSLVVHCPSTLLSLPIRYKVPASVANGAVVSRQKS